MKLVKYIITLQILTYIVILVLNGNKQPERLVQVGHLVLRVLVVHLVLEVHLVREVHLGHLVLVVHLVVVEHLV